MYVDDMHEEKLIKLMHTRNGRKYVQTGCDAMLKLIYLRFNALESGKYILCN